MLFGMLTPTHLRCEYLVDPIGIDIPAPRLSWVDESSRNGESQKAYRIVVASDRRLLSRGVGDLWDSGRVESPKAAQIPYRGRALKPGERAWWEVSVWDGADGPKTSHPAFWETGLLDRSNWTAQWVSLPPAKDGRPSPYVRHEFELKGPIASARAYVTARGLYRLWIDGQRVGKGLLTPDWTDYRKRILYQTYDVTDLLQPGPNAIGMQLGDGWYCGHVGLTGGDNYGTRPMGLVQLEVTYQDGTTERVASDGTWRATAGPILGSDLLMGETYDARQDLGDWTEPGYEDLSWRRADTSPLDGTILEGQYSPLVSKLQEIRPKKLTEPKPGVFVFDLGQNMVGWARLRIVGRNGQKIQLRFAEMLNPDGTVYTTNLRGAKATDTYTLAGAGWETYEPSFTFHGFRYVELTGSPEKPSLDTIWGIVVGTDAPKTGSFECSNKLVNQIQHNIFWGQRGNYVSIPTDCPQRDERLGWMGDAQIFARTACFNNDVSSFLTKWVQDVVDAQSPEGGFSDVSPRMGDPSDGAPAWGDAGVIVPWTIYQCYGDERILERFYPAMAKWIEYIDSVNPDHLWLKRTNNNFGDWLNVHDDSPREVLSTAFFAHSTDLVARAARIIGKTDDAERYENLSDQIRSAFVSNYVDADGKIKGDTQTDYLLALHFDLLPENLRGPASRRLVEHILVDRSGYLSTGFLGVGYMNPTLTDIGRVDVAYRLLENTGYPSWGYEIKHGATTIWERWDGWTEEKGFQDPGMNSFNHYAFGSVGEWMYRTVGGIDVDPDAPGYEKIVMKPMPGGGLSWVKAGLDSLHGHIESDWRVDSGKFLWTVKVPANTSATVYVPGTDVTVSDSTNAKHLRREGGAEVYEVPGGTYKFEASLLSPPKT